MMPEEEKAARMKEYEEFIDNETETKKTIAELQRNPPGGCRATSGIVETWQNMRSLLHPHPPNYLPVALQRIGKNRNTQSRLFQSPLSDAMTTKTLEKFDLTNQFPLKEFKYSLNQKETRNQM